MTPQQECAAWNSAHRAGELVRVRRDNGDVEERKTRSEAYVLSGHTALIWLDGMSGCYLLSRVTAIEEREPA